MKTSLLKEAKNEQEEKELRQTFVASHFLREKLRDKLRKDIEISQNRCMSSDYDVSNWAYKQAHEMGYQKALSEVISLIFD